SGRGHQTQRIPEEFVHQPVRFSRYPHQASMAALEWVNDSQGSQPFNSEREGPVFDLTSSSYSSPRLPHFQARPRPRARARARASIPVATSETLGSTDTLSVTDTPQRLPVGFRCLGSLADSQWSKGPVKRSTSANVRGVAAHTHETGAGSGLRQQGTALDDGSGQETLLSQERHSVSDEPAMTYSDSCGDKSPFQTDSCITSDSELSFPEDITRPRNGSPRLALIVPGSPTSPPVSTPTDPGSLSMTRLFVSRESIRPSRTPVASPSPLSGSVDDVHCTETDTCTDATGREGEIPRQTQRRERKRMPRSPLLSPVAERTLKSTSEAEGEPEAEVDERGMQQTFSSSLQLPFRGDIDWGKVTSKEGRELHYRNGRQDKADRSAVRSHSRSTTETDPLHPEHSVTSFSGQDTRVDSMYDIAHPPGVSLALQNLRLDPQVPSDDSNIWSARVGCYQPINTSDGAQAVFQLNSIQSVLHYLGEEGNPSGSTSTFVTPVEVISMLRYPADAIPYLGFVLHTHFSLESVVSLNRCL
ncbi:hypothetical protein KIPB_010986, partial [Kipferlia bialata]